MRTVPFRPLASAAALVLLAVSIAARDQAAPDDRIRALARESLAKISGELRVPGLKASVEVIRDRWGVPHIYAQNTDDLFFAQGYVMAQDRLWQMEMWRREREAGWRRSSGRRRSSAIGRRGMLKYRGPMDDREWTSYHPDGKRIFTAYAAGVNAFIAERRTICRSSSS